MRLVSGATVLRPIEAGRGGYDDGHADHWSQVAAHVERYNSVAESDLLSRE